MCFANGQKRFNKQTGKTKSNVSCTTKTKNVHNYSYMTLLCYKMFQPNVYVDLVSNVNAGYDEYGICYVEYT